MIHIAESKKLITRSLVELYEDEIAIMGLECTKCHKELGEGDYMDGFYPYETEYNLCKECVEAKE